MKAPKIRPVRINLFSSVIKKNAKLRNKNRKLKIQMDLLLRKSDKLLQESDKLIKGNEKLRKESIELRNENQNLKSRLGKLEKLINENAVFFEEKSEKMKLLDGLTRQELVKILEKEYLSCAGSKTSIQTRVCSNFTYKAIEQNVRKLKPIAKDTLTDFKPKIECSFCGKSFINLKLHLRSCKMKCQKHNVDFNFNQN